MTLEVKNLSAGFLTKTGVNKILHDINFSIPAGKTLALLGESGCGKSLTALAIMQLLPLNAFVANNSQIILDEQNLLVLPEMRMRAYRGKKIGIIFQEPMTSLNPVLTVGQQISEILTLHFTLSKQQKYNKIVDLLQQVNIPAPEKRIDEYPHQLSGGMKQRVMIAMALAGDPDILIADEPTTALDVTIQAQILLLLQELQSRRQMSILLITHDLGVVRELADEVAVMYAGVIVEHASSEQFFNQPLHPYSKKLFASIPSLNKRNHALAMLAGTVPKFDNNYHLCRFISRCDLVKEQCQTSIPPLIAFSNQQQVLCHLYGNNEFVNQIIMPKSSDDNGVNVGEKTPAACVTNEENLSLTAPLLKVENLALHFPIYKGFLKKQVATVKAVDGINLSIAAGKTLALVGESGCGKSTIGRSILRLLQPTAGKLFFRQQDYTNFSYSKLIPLRKEIQIIFQDPYSSLNPRMMVKDILEEGMLALNIEKSAQVRQQKIDKLLVDTGLPVEAKYRYPHEFSGGQRQRICIARALAVNPRIIICDEPTSALDVSVQAQIINLLTTLQRQYNVAYLFISHNISVVSYLADEVAVMYLGRIVEHGPALEVLTSPKHPYTQALLAAVLEIDQPKKAQTTLLTGELPSPINPPPGCHFQPRCNASLKKCTEQYPPAIQLANKVEVKCFLYETSDN